MGFERRPGALLAGLLLIPTATGLRAPFTTTGLALAETTGRRTITVSTTSDATNGDTSSHQALLADPGSDGISLREAITVTNNDPDRYAIRFDPSLADSTIKVGSDAQLDLPRLEGGRVAIGGDIDGDGSPDVTLRRGFDGLGMSSTPCRCAFVIASSGNKLRDLRVRGFPSGVIFASTRLSDTDSFDTHRTYSDNVLSGLVMTGLVMDAVALIWYSPECDSSVGEAACETHNSWVDTRIVGNTIRTRRYGIRSPLTGVGDRVARWTVANNKITITGSGQKEQIGIRFEAGLSLGSTRTKISDLVIARNEIRGKPGRAMFLAAGMGASDANTIEGVKIVDNRILPDGCPSTCEGIVLNLGENSDVIGWDADPVQHGDRNLIRDVAIEGNAIRGDFSSGISASAGCCSTRSNKLKDLRIVGNTIRTGGLVTGIGIGAGFTGEVRNRYSAGNRVSDVVVKSNDIAIRAREYGPKPHPRWSDGFSATLRLGGIVMVGGYGRSRDGRITNVKVTGNDIDTELIAVSFIGGTWFHKEAPKDNVIFGIKLIGNKIARTPRIPRYVLTNAKGISLIGGFNGARNNRVACAVLRRNQVAGVQNDLLVVANPRGPGTPPVGNVATLTCP